MFFHNGFLLREASQNSRIDILFLQMLLEIRFVILLFIKGYLERQAMNLKEIEKYWLE